MPVRAHELSDGGVVLVCSTTNLPLQVSTQLFRDEEQAAWFLASLPVDARRMDPEEMQEAASQWVNAHPSEPGSVCGDYPAVPSPETKPATNEEK